MQRLTIEDIIERIQQGMPLDAVSMDYSFTLKIEQYVPYVCAAVHDGHQFRRELWDVCTHSEYERWYEEDPCTREFIKDMPIVIAGRDSRFEYDLNREPENAVFEDAWGKKLWKSPLEARQRSKSLEKHHNFYRVVRALIEKLENVFTHVVVYDVHSYNWRRWDREVPLINLGTTQIDNERYGEMVELWRKELEGLDLPNGVETAAKVNDTFFGRGYFLKFITQNFKNSLVLATEFKKVYCDELEEVIFPEVVQAIREQFRPMILSHAAQYKRTFDQ